MFVALYIIKNSELQFSHYRNIDEISSFTYLEHNDIVGRDYVYVSLKTVDVPKYYALSSDMRRFIA